MGWPRALRVSRPWQPPLPAELLPRSVRTLVGEPFTALAPAPIADAEVRLPGPVRIAVLEAQVAMARLDAATRSGPLKAPGLLLRAEAVASCLVDGMTVDALSMSMGEIGLPTGPDAHIAIQRAAGLRAAARSGDAPVTTLLTRAHAAVVGDELHDPGRTARGPVDATGGPWRPSVTWVGGPSPHHAVDVPSPPDLISSAMADLDAFSARQDLDAISAAAITLAQLSIIAPLIDDNDAVARIAAHTAARRWSLPRSAAVPLSAGLATESNQLSAAFTSYRDGDPSVIIHLMARAVVAACSNAQLLWEDLVELSGTWNQTISARSDASLWPILALLLRQPIVTTAIVRGEIGISHTNAMKAITRLESEGIIQRWDERQRSILWVQPEVIIAHDAFTARCRVSSPRQEDTL